MTGALSFNGVVTAGKRTLSFHVDDGICTKLQPVGRQKGVVIGNFATGFNSYPYSCCSPMHSL